MRFRVSCRLLILAMVAGVSACSNSTDQDLAPPDPSGPVSSPPPAPGPITPGSDVNWSQPTQCGAEKYQWLRGRKKAVIPARPSGATWRISCTECALTEDYSPQRLNILFDQHTEIIEKVYCGYFGHVSVTMNEVRSGGRLRPCGRAKAEGAPLLQATLRIFSSGPARRPVMRAPRGSWIS